MATFQARRIVSSYLTLGEYGLPTFRVALFKRSPQKDVYPGMWAVCSGKVETSDKSPVAAAWREIKEETGLVSPKLELSKEGAMIEQADRNLLKMWHIFPFVFKLKEGAQDKRAEDLIQLDAEHTEVKFVTLEQMRQMETVDNLYENLLKALEDAKP